MKRFIYLALLCTVFIFTSCIPETYESIKEINYSTPTIIDNELDIGLFAPFEVPLVQEREYEFTATTSYRFVRVHFVIPDKTDKWVSLRNLESKIFSQNLTIPKGTSRVEIGIANRPNATGSEVSIYAVYNVIPLNDFKSYIKDEERRREYEEVPTAEIKPELESYEKIVIDHKYTTKYPKSLKRGENYIFEIGPFDSSYCILNSSNNDNFQWIPVEKEKSKDGEKSKYFKINYQIPNDAEEFRIALSSTSTTFIESLVSFNLTGKIDEKKKSRREGEKIVISSASMSTLNIYMEDEKFYKLSVDSFGGNYKYCQIFCSDINGEQIDFCVLDRVDDKYETNCFYVPDRTENISIYLSNDYFSGLNRIAYLTVDDIRGNPIPAGTNIKKRDNYITENPDEELMDFLKGMKDTNPDTIVDKCVYYIQNHAENDFHKIKLVHDAIWYLASYDLDSLNSGDYYPWDFRTVLSRRLCVCAGFSRTFVYFCEKLDMRAINILGTALNGNERTPKEIEDQNHAWTMVEIEDGWYLFDLTWDCSLTQNKVNNHYYSCDYFMAEPKDFIKRHYPANSEKQLLDNPYTSAEMVRLIRE